MATERTHVTELATAAGMMLGAEHADLDMRSAVELPGIPEAVWRPWLEQGQPECKVQLRAPVNELPGYQPVA